MIIEPPSNFWHAGDLSPRFASRDPRQETYTASELDIDLRMCSFGRLPCSGVQSIRCWLLCAASHVVSWCLRISAQRCTSNLRDCTPY